MKKTGLLLGCLALLAVVAVVVAMWGVGVRNSFVNKEEAVNSQWAQVENVYQRRIDLIPNLVKTVQGSANFEKSTLQAVIEARAKAGQVMSGGGSFNPSASAANPTSNPQAFEQFQAAQDQLTGALRNFVNVVVERYPDIKSTQNFSELQAQLEGTENRIAVERHRFNEKAQEFNTAIRQFPASMIASFSGFTKKPYFKSVAGADRPPEVNFDFNNSGSAASPTTTGGK